MTPQCCSGVTSDMLKSQSLQVSYCTVNRANLLVLWVTHSPAAVVSQFQCILHSSNIQALEVLTGNIDVMKIHCMQSAGEQSSPLGQWYTVCWWQMSPGWTVMSMVLGSGIQWCNSVRYIRGGVWCPRVRVYMFRSTPDTLSGHMTSLPIAELYISQSSSS